MAARANSLFRSASDLTDPAERAAYLDRECWDDTELRDRVEALLTAHDGAGPSRKATPSARPNRPQPKLRNRPGDPTRKYGCRRNS